MRILGCALLSAGLTTGFIQTRLPLIRHNKPSSCHTSFTPPSSSSRSRLSYSANDYLDNLPKFVSDEKPLGSFATDTYLNTLSQFTDPASASVAIYKPEEYLQNLCSTFIENNNGVVSSVSERIGELSKLSAQENSISILSGLASDSPSIQSPDFSNLKQDLSESLESIKSEIPIFANQGSSGNDQDSAPNTINDSQSTTDSMNTVIASNSDEQISTSSNPTDTFEAASISDYTDNIDTSLASTSSIESTTVSDNQPYLSENSVSNTESIPSNDVSESVSIANDGESTFVSNSIDDSIIDSSVGFDQSLPVEPSVPESMPETTINSVLTSDTLEQLNINNNENVDVSEYAGLPEEKPTLFDTTDPATKTFFNDMFEDASSPETIIASDNAQVIDRSASSTDVGNSLASTSNDVPDFSNTVSEQPSLAYIVDSTENVLSSSNNNNFEGIVDNNDFTDSFSDQNSIGASEYIPENSFEQSAFETDVFRDTSAFASNNGETEQAQTSFENNFDTPEPVNTFSEASETTTDTSYSTNTEGFDDSTAFASNNIEMEPSTNEETNDFSNNFGISESESVQDSVYSAENNLGQPTFEESTTFASDDMQMEQVQATYENNEDISNSFDSSELESTQNSMETVYDSSYNTDGFVENTAFETENVEMDQGIIDGTNNNDFSNSYSVPESETVQNSMDTVYTSSENRFEQNAPGESTTFASENIEMKQVQATYENDDYFSNSFDSSDLGNTQNGIKSEIVQDSMESAYTSENVEMNQQASFESGNDLSNNNGLDSPTVDNSQVSTSTGFESASVSSTDDSRFEDTSAFATNNLDMGESNYEETNTFANSFSVSEPEETMRNSLDTSFTSENSYEQVEMEQGSYENINDISNSFYSSDIDTSQGSTSTLYESTSTPSSDAFEGEASFGSNNIEVEQASYEETDTFSNSFSSQEYDNNIQSSMDTVHATENRFEQSTTEPETVFQSSSIDEIEQANYESSADFSNVFSTSGGESTQDNTNTVYESASTSASSIDGSSDSTSFTSNDIDTFSVDNMNGVSNSYGVPELENIQETIDSTYSSVSASTF